MSLTEQERQIIVAHWFRKLISADISIQDMLRIIVKFSEVYEEFDKSLSHKSIKIEDDGMSLSKNDYGDRTAFGIVVARTGKTYHWKLKVIESGDTDINIGIADKDKCKENDTGGWWYTKYGYSYWSYDGYIYHSNQDLEYGEEFGTGDIIDMWLDLKDNKRELSFAKNEIKFGKAFDVKHSTDFKFALTMSGAPYKIELMCFEMY